MKKSWFVPELAITDRPYNCECKGVCIFKSERVFCRGEYFGFAEICDPAVIEKPTESPLSVGGYIEYKTIPSPAEIRIRHSIFFCFFVIFYALYK